MAQTTDEIAISVLQKLGRLPDGQVAPASQRATVKTAYTELYNELLDDGIVNWSESDNIPEAAANIIKTILCGRVADNFGVPNQWLQLEEIMKKRLSGLLQSPYVSQPTDTDYY